MLRYELKKIIFKLQENIDNIFCNEYNKIEKDNIYEAIQELRDMVGYNEK